MPDPQNESTHNPMEWCIEQFQKVVDNLERLPRTEPKNEAAAKVYAAGLYDMASWVLEQLQQEHGWKAFSGFLRKSGFPLEGVPQHGFEITFSEPATQPKRTPRKR